MKDNRIRAYVKLIQELLDCPSGEEVNLLRENQDLVDFEFLYVLEQAAAKAEKEGKEESATFLGDLARQLKLIFGQAAEMTNPDRGNRTAAYVNVIESMLSCDRGEEVAVILRNNQELIDRGFVQTLGQVAQVMMEKGQQESATFLINIAYEISKVIDAQ